MVFHYLSLSSKYISNYKTRFNYLLIEFYVSLLKLELQLFLQSLQNMCGVYVFNIAPHLKDY